MSRFRFSLLGLAGLVALIALGCASLAYASPAVSGIAWSAALLTMMFGKVIELPARGLTDDYKGASLGSA